MIGGHGRIGDAKVYTLSCQDRIVLDENANLDVNNIKAFTIYCSDICARSPTIPIFVSSNITFGEDVAFQKDLFIEGNLIAGSSGTLDITGNLILTNKLSILGGLSVGTDALIKGNLTVNDKLCAVNLITAKNGLDVVGDMNVDGGMTVVQDVLFEGNVTGGNLNISGNLDVNGNLTVQDLYVHTIHGFSPVNFNDIASFGKGANFKQLVKLLAADLQATLGAKIRIMNGSMGGALECDDAAPIMMDKGLFHNIGGNVMVTKTFEAPTGGHLMVMGGNINVTGHNITGGGSIAVLDGGDINLRNGGSITINDGGNVVVTNGGNIIIGGGGTLVMVDNMGVPKDALTFPIPEFQGGTNQTTYATGDILYASGPDLLSKLPISADGQLLIISGGLPTWGPPPGGGGGTVMSVTAGSGINVGAGPGGMITTTGILNIAPLGVTDAMLAGSITNAKLTNSSITVTAGTGLTGGGAVALGASTMLSIPNAGVTNAMLTNSSVTVVAGTGLSGGGSISLGGMTTLNLTVPVSVANGGTNITSYVAGDLLYATGATTLTKLPVGTAGQALTVSGGGLPVWTTPGGGGTVTNVTAGSGLNVGAGPGGMITTTGTLNIAPLGVTDAMLAGSITNAKLSNSSITVTAGTGLTGGGAVSLGGITTLNAASPIVTTFTVNGSWTKNAATRYIELYMWGGGAGGNAGSITLGGFLQSGPGGNPGGGVFTQGHTSLFPSTATVTIGSGGAGAIGVTQLSQNPSFVTGATGSPGGNTSFGSITTTTSATGGITLGSAGVSVSFSPTSVTGLNGSPVITSGTNGMNLTGVPGTAGNGGTGAIGFNQTGGAVAIGIISGGTGGGVGGNWDAPFLFASGTAGNGGMGGFPGGGGGGGGSVNRTSSNGSGNTYITGNGGAGGNGCVIVIEYL